ncbi:hypothetical protein [Streptomyces platensis]|uniref:hypothetical protein n=1 Tax=Streptomyces platensis TaxID=58346 RepID=UPI0037AE02A1
MGYRKTIRRIEVSLKGHPTFGQEADYPVAVARGKTLDEYLRLMGHIETPDGDEQSGVIRQLEEFGDSLISWNLEHHETGEPLPCTREALFSLDNDLAMALATDWLERLGGKVDRPLPSGSPDGGPSPEASIPMEPLSGSPLPTAVPA